MLLIATNTVRLPYYSQNMQTKIPYSAGTRSKLLPCSSVDKVSLNEEKKFITRSKLLEKARLSVSSYDTAWVAMVPSKESREKPMFPECLEWVMKNQHPDGSWCSNYPGHPLLVKDSLSSTLACVLALHKWQLGDSLVQRGLEYIEANCWAAIDEKQLTPIGFDIIFPAMIELALQNGLELPLDSSLLDGLQLKRDTEVTRCDLKATKAYLLEGMGGNFEWEEIIKHGRRSNGSFSNSPSATAAALFHNHSQPCYNYLSSLLMQYDNAVPTVHPLEIYSQLRTIDNFQKLGVDRYCRNEIENALDNIYRYWLLRDEEIYSDINCCALGFRLLRMHGYDISSEALSQYSEEEHYFSSVSPQFKNTNTILELFKASKIMIYQKEPVLEKLEAWTGSFLKQQMLTGAIQDQRLREEVDHVLKYHYHSLDFLERRWIIEQQKTDSVQLLKTSYRSLNDDNKNILALAIQDYNMCQSLYQEEYKDLERWVKDCRFDELKFARLLLLNCYYANTAILAAPELAEARISIAKNSVLATVIDDLFDVGGSQEELQNLIQLVERWGETSSIGFYSEHVEIIFSALENMIKELDAIAFKHHGRSVERHLVQIWNNLIKSMMKEAEWARGNVIPPLDEYMEAAYISSALGPICHITTYFLGTTLPEKVMAGPEICNLLKHVGLVGRLLNDLRSFKRECEEGKYNSIHLRVLHSQGTMTEEEAIDETKKDIEKYRKEMLRLVVQKKESSLPKPFRDFFWRFCNLLHYFYMDNDGYSNPKTKMANDAKAVLWEPITP
ncbi:ent-kaurene synthase, chloroplastic isoform X1 [Ricinus communis]|nr:ent-kaurene synthase, chloroplastic isoform X1 [Ricinus communis]